MTVRQQWSALSRDQRALLVPLGATTLFDGYDRGILEIALPQIRGTYGLTQAEASRWLTLVYLGALPALVVTRRADRVGRRRLLLTCVVAYTVATGLTAAAPTIGVYTACQFVARLFLNAEAAIVWTLAAAELPARSRGFGFGVLAMNAALGVGRRRLYATRFPDTHGADLDDTSGERTAAYGSTGA